MSSLNIGGMPILQMTKPSAELEKAKPSLDEIGKDSPQFSEFLKQSMKEVVVAQKDADHAISELMAGESKDIHSTMIKMQQASVSLQMMMQVRNKIVDAYQEVMRTQV